MQFLYRYTVRDFDGQFYIKCAVLKTLCTVLERNLCRLRCLSIKRDSSVTVECCLYIVISNKYGDKT